MTLSDLIEELVGEIRENPADSKNEEPSIRQIDDNTWEITGDVYKRQVLYSTSRTIVMVSSCAVMP